MPRRRVQVGRRSVATLFASQRTWHVLAALVLVTVTLAVLSIQAVRHEALVRKNLVVDTYRGVANLVSARLSDALAEGDRAIAGAAGDDVRPSDAIFDVLDDVERARPWLHPLVVVTDGAPDRQAPPNDEPIVEQSSTAAAFAALVSSAEREELRLGHLDTAVGLYAKAATEAATPIRRLEALNGLARTEFKAGRFGRSIAAYNALLASADSLDPAQARWAVLARDRLLQCDSETGDQGALARHALDLYRFLIRYRYLLDRDAVDFYRRRVTETIGQTRLDDSQREAWQRLRDREEMFVSLDDTIREVTLDKQPSASASLPPVALIPIGRLGPKNGGPSVSVAYSLESSNLRVLLDRTLREPGPWSEIGIGLVDSDGHAVSSSLHGPVPADATAATTPIASRRNLRVVAFPRSGSVEDLVAREVNRYTVWLVLVFGTVVAALALAARSVSRELTLSRLRSDFVASVSHELKTPLSLIRMFAESLREGWVAEPQKQDYYEIITRESERLTGLINNVLDFSRIESGTRQYQFAVVDLRQLVVDLLERYEFHLRAANVELVKEIPADSAFARVDHDAIEQVIVNLLSNAVKYMGDSSRQPRQVRVSLDRSGDHLILRVSDTGIGMSDEHRTHIFERFYRANDERVRAVTGSGLGLTLVKAHVDAHAGTIAVESIPGQGSTFAISLPLATEAVES